LGDELRPGGALLENDSMVAEIEYLDDGAIIFRVPFRRLWVDTVKQGVPSDHRGWDPDMKAWTVWPPYAETVLVFTRQTFGSVREVNKADQTADDHVHILHLRETAPLELIESAYRTLAKICHPDRGGDHATMRQINSAYEALRERVSA
jgi:hypothetical protein